MKRQLKRSQPRVTIERIVIQEDGTAYRYVEERYSTGVVITRRRLDVTQSIPAQ